MMRRGHALWIAAFCGGLGFIAGCESESSNPTEADAASDADTGGDESDAQVPASLFGYFNVKLEPMKEATPITMAMAAKTSVIGAFADGPTPVADPWKVGMEDGDCRLLLPHQPLCDPGCRSTAVCVAQDGGQGTCIEVPEALGVGPVHVMGLGDPFDIDRIAGSRTYQLAPGMTLSYPPCDEGHEVRFEASGGGFEPFELVAPCIAPISFPGPIALEPNMPLQLTWQAPSDPDAARVLVEIDISHHGGSRGLIECDVPDTGSLEIAASLVDGLIDLGVSGFPSVSVTRSVEARGSTAQSAEVVLTISSRFTNYLELPGLTSCTSDEHCEGDQTCQPDFRCE